MERGRVHRPRLRDQPGVASLLTDEIKGKPLDDVAGIARDDLLDLLGIEISPARLKCAMLSLRLPPAPPRRGRRQAAGRGGDGVMHRCACRRPA